MTATLTAPPSTTRAIAPRDLLLSEWTKLRSLRSNAVCAGLIVLSVLGIAVLMGARWAATSRTDPPGKLGNFDATNVTLSGVYLAQVVAGTLGVLVISSEYGSGMIRASLAAVPRRRELLAAKAVVVATSVLVLGEVVCLTGFLIGQALLAGTGHGASLGDPGALRSVVGAGLYLAAATLLGFGLGALLRNTAAALSAFFGVLFALTVLADLLPTNLRNDIINYLPANSGSQIFTTVPTSGALAPWTGLGVFCLYALVALVAAFALVERRDA